MNTQVDREWRGLCRVGGVASWILFAYSLATMVQVLALGGPPTSAAEAFSLLQTNKLVGLLRLDLPTVFAMALYYPVFLGLFAALRNADRVYAGLCAALAFVGVTLVLAAPTALPMLSLSDKHAAATTEAARLQFLAAGEALLASDLWHSSSSLVGGILGQTAAVLISAVMLRSTVFSRTIAWVGIVMHGLDLAHIVLGLFVPVAGFVLMAVAGPLYLVWFPLIGRRMTQLARA
jgi:hypothetical protein